MPKTPIIDYRRLRPDNINSEEFKHVKYLLFWPLFGITFWFVERIGVTDNYFIMYCPVDDMIPFCEFFLIPYLFWFVYLVGMLLYAFLFESSTFVKLMKYIIVTYTATMVVYFLFPTAQELRPDAFVRDNVLTRFMGVFYSFDTNTNVCPSLHVIGSVAVMFSAWHSKRFRSPLWRVLFVFVAVMISISTVFLKQHSILDVVAAIPVCIGAYFVVYGKRAI